MLNAITLASAEEMPPAKKKGPPPRPLLRRLSADTDRGNKTLGAADTDGTCLEFAPVSMHAKKAFVGVKKCGEGMTSSPTERKVFFLPCYVRTKEGELAKGQKKIVKMLSCKRKLIFVVLFV